MPKRKVVTLNNLTWGWYIADRENDTVAIKCSSLFLNTVYQLSLAIALIEEFEFSTITELEESI